jgi:hypothetical protein
MIRGRVRIQEQWTGRGKGPARTGRPSGSRKASGQPGTVLWMKARMTPTVWMLRALLATAVLISIGTLLAWFFMMLVQEIRVR